MGRLQTEQRWRAWIAEQEESGLSIAAWCREHEVRTQTMYWWRSELRRRDRTESQCDVPRFVPVEVVPARSEPERARLRVIAGGREVIVEGTVDQEQLAQVVLLLESLPC